MYRYILLNIMFFAAAGLILLTLRPLLINWRLVRTSSLIMFGCMIVFNTYLTALPIVRYNTSYTLNVRLGTIPIEDFSYLIVAVVLAPALFLHFRSKETTRDSK